jgi:hypothetical protein
LDGRGWVVSNVKGIKGGLGSENILKTFGPKFDEVTGEWGKLHSKGLRNTYFSLNSVRLMKTRKMKWVGV